MVVFCFCSGKIGFNAFWFNNCLTLEHINSVCLPEMWCTSMHRHWNTQIKLRMNDNSVKCFFFHVMTMSHWLFRLKGKTTNNLIYYSKRAHTNILHKSQNDKTIAKCFEWRRQRTNATDKTNNEVIFVLWFAYAVKFIMFW